MPRPGLGRPAEDNSLHSAPPTDRQRRATRLDDDAVRHLGLEHLLCSVTCQASHAMCNRTWLPLAGVQLAAAAECKIKATMETGQADAVAALENLGSEAGASTLRLLCERLASLASNAVLHGECVSMELALQSLIIGKAMAKMHCSSAAPFSYLIDRTLHIASGDLVLITCLNDLMLTGFEAVICNLHAPRRKG